MTNEKARSLAGSGTLVDGVYFDVRLKPDRAAPIPAIFLDRDGVLVELVEYLHDPAQVRLTEGAGATLAVMNQRGVPVLLVTNQSGIGRGFFGWNEFHATQAEMERQLASWGARLDAVAACPHHESGRPPYDIADHPCRKPNPGMLRGIASRAAIDLGRSWLVGDHSSDVATARAAGLAGAVHVATGHGERERRLVLEGLAASPGQASMPRVEFRASLADAGKFLLPELIASAP